MAFLRANECSPSASWSFGQYKKPFTDGEAVKECMRALDKTLLEGHQKQKRYFKKIKYFILKCIVFKKLFYSFSLFNY